ncbi:unnamed protein product [Mytilus coruscus]|uniref:One cut domain family member n=1 Tax=Mytilus coruscus TaxID=42192 RepID=A0A6J8BV88_MYTCO|nr:unnamed protein product [Mytilus coruscus]
MQLLYVKLDSETSNSEKDSEEPACGSRDIPPNVYDWESGISDDDMPNLEIPKRQKKKAQKLSSEEENLETDCSNPESDSEDEPRQDVEEEEGNQDSVEEEGDQDSVEEEEGDQGAPNDHEEPNKESDSESDDSNLMDIETISKLFRKKFKKFGISQRMAAKNILKCSQSTISELYAKASRLKSSKELSLRGRELYDKMQTWLSSSAAQKETQRSIIQQRAYDTKPTQPRKKGSKAVKFSAVQMAVLVKLYRKDDRPATKKQQLIAEVLNLEIHQIRTWFNNQRARNFPAGKEHSSQNIPDDLDIFVNNY